MFQGYIDQPLYVAMKIYAILGETVYVIKN